MNAKAQQLQDKLDTLTEQLEAIGQDGADDKAKAVQIKTLSEQIAAVSAEIKTLSIADDTERTAQAAAIKAANDRIAELEADVRRRSVAEKVATVKVPAFRPGFEAMYAYALTHAAEKVRVYTKDKDGKETSEEQTLVQITDAFVKQVNSQAEKLFNTLATTGAQPREDGTQDKDPGVELDRKVKAYQAAHPEVKDYLDALAAVRAADPELVRRYNEQTVERASTH